MTEPRACPTCGAPLPADAAGGACPKCLLVAGFATGPGSGPAAGTRVPTPEELAPKFPGLVIESMLGRGGMGVVYKARHRALDREVALKILPAAAASDRAFAERFQREARALAKLQHPNIVAVHDFGETDGLFWLVMEYVDGANIRQAMRAGRIRPKEALAIVPQICDALQYAHEHGVVHRDIKPENVLLDKSGRVKVADFGLAKMMETSGGADHTLTGAGQVMGTPHYMAPEQWEHPKDVDHRADIYSLGVVFYEMLTGELPVGRFAAPSKKSDIDARIDEIVLRTLEREREARYQHVADVKTDVGRAASSPAVPAIAAPEPTRPTPEQRRRAGWLTLAGVVACALLLFVVTSDAVSGGLRTIAAVFAIVVGALLVAHVWSLRRARRGDAPPSRAQLSGCAVAALVVAGLLGVGVLAVLGLLLVSGRAPEGPASLAPSAPERTETWLAYAADRDRLVEPFRHLKAAYGASGLRFEDALPYYGPMLKPWLEGMSAEERDRRAGKGELGLPLLAPSLLEGTALSGFEVTDVRWTPRTGEPKRAWVTARSGSKTLHFTMYATIATAAHRGVEPAAPGERVWYFETEPATVE